MRRLTVLLAMLAALAAPIAADEDRRFPANATFTTLQITPLAIEGLTGDEFGNLYTTGRAAAPARCPVWQIGPGGGLVEFGSIGNAAPVMLAAASLQRKRPSAATSDGSTGRRLG